MRWRSILSHTYKFLFPRDEELGPEFLEEIRREALRGLLAACWMALVAGLTFTAVYVLLLRQRFPKLCWATVLLGLAGILICYTRSGKTHPRGVSVVLALGIGTLLVANQVAAGTHTYGHFGGLITILMVMGALGPLQPFWVLLSGVYFFILYVVAGVWLDPTVGWPPAATFVLPCASLAVSGIISVWLSGVLHRSRRTEFQLRDQLSQAFRDLQDAQAQLLASEKALTQSQLVAAFSHELNNPLGVIVSNLSTQARLLQRLEEKCAVRASAEEIGGLTTVQHELNQSSTAAAHRMKTLLDKMREFSHLDQSESQRIDLNGELLQALEMVKLETRSSVQVETQLNALPEVFCQPQKLSMAFASLLRNAFQAVEDQGTVRLQTAHINGEIEILIEDNGPGIDPVELKRIFDPKFVPQSGRIRASWGLATSQQIVLQHGGQLELSSKVGKGTTARVRLPANRSNNAAQSR
jgi:signal transduction histidine kinase